LRYFSLEQNGGQQYHPQSRAASVAKKLVVLNHFNVMAVWKVKRIT